jgi:CDP-glycerol glycerophosphotransferase
LSIKKIKGNSIWIDTWHGIGFKIHKKEEYGQCMSMYDIQFVTSDFFKDIYELKFGFKSEQLVITGYPRTDILLEREINIRDESRPNIDDSKKIILYAPTYENVASFIDIFPWDLEMTLKTLDDFCKKFGCAFCIRPHPNSGIEKSETTIIRNYETIKLIDMNEYPDTQKLLLNTDILITDWSSICFDFILLKKPMLFIDVPPPRADFTLGPDDRPGEIVNDLNELIEALTLIMTEGNGYALNHGNEINKILNKCYKYVDGKSSKRCVDLIHGLINDPN